MFEDGVTVSAKSDIYSFGMTVLEVGSMFVVRLVLDPELCPVIHASGTIRRYQEKYTSD